MSVSVVHLLGQRAFPSSVVIESSGQQGMSEDKERGGLSHKTELHRLRVVTLYHQEIEQTDSHPQCTPHGVDDGNEDVVGEEPKQPCAELSKNGREGDKREEDLWISSVTPTPCNIRCSDDSGASEAGQS